MSQQSTSDGTTKNDAGSKLTRERLSVLELARELSNVSEACRRSSMDRTCFYEYKRRFQLQGLERLKDLPPVAKSHPQTTSDDVVQQIVAIALEHPAWGCNRTRDQLALAGIAVSFLTVQNILNKQGLGMGYECSLKLEERVASEFITLSEEQIRLIEKANPALREGHVERSRPRELLSQGIFYVAQLNGIGKVYLHTVVDTFGCYAFGFLHTSKQPQAVVAVVHNKVILFYQARNIPIGAILTDNGPEFCGTEQHPYELYYNTERPHQGYRNIGKRPIDIVDIYLKERALGELAQKLLTPSVSQEPKSTAQCVVQTECSIHEDVCQ